MGPLLAALEFLTILPIPQRATPAQAELRRCLPFFPLVGALIGALVGCVDLVNRAVFPPLVADVVAVLLLAVLTGALHLDGLADTFDGVLAPGREPRERLAIMRDSHVGAFGVLGLVFLLLAKIAAVGQLDPTVRPIAFASAGALGRWAIVHCYWAHSYARPEPTLSAELKRGASGIGYGLAALSAVIFAIVLGWTGVLLFGTVAAFAASFSNRAASRLGGVTGDVCGATCELSETFALLLIPTMIALLQFR